MTDKQIIIDGVNVSGCEKQGETIAGITCGNGERIRLANEIITKHKLCKDNPNCVYKQLKAKEQECEELKKIINEAKNSNLDLKSFLVGEAVQNEYEQQLDQLKSENDGLKTMLKDLSYENQKFCYQIEEQTKQLEPFKDEYFKGLDNVAIAKLAKKSIRITAENSKLEQTLIEIKEIAEWHTTSADTEDVQEDIKQILQKISELENDNK